MLTLEIKQPKRIQWKTTNGFFHNLLNPAYTSWYENGRKECETYWVNNKYQRDPNIGPATIVWHSNGQKKHEAYYLHDKLHRDPQLGPAHTYWYKDGQKSGENYYVNNKQVDKPC
jgi:antitoxin component YwqK of YwqJK toxin-antitoxin module